MSFGSKGGGPNEFFEPIFNTKVNGRTQKRDNLWIHDLEKGNLVCLAINENGVSIIKESKVPDTKAGYITKIILETDSSLIFVPEEIGRLAFFNKVSGESKILPYSPVVDQNIKENQKWMIFQSEVAVHADLGLIAAAPILLGQLDFFDFSGNLVKSFIYDQENHNSNELSNENVTKSNLKHYARDIESSDESIFLLVTERTFSQVRAKEYTNTSKILEFDWEGGLINEFVLDNYIESFAYDKTLNRFYGFHPFDEKNPFWVYTIG